MVSAIFGVSLMIRGKLNGKICEKDLMSNQLVPHGKAWADKTEVYGTGAFLAAGSDVYKLSQQ